MLILSQKLYDVYNKCGFATKNFVKNNEHKKYPQIAI